MKRKWTAAICLTMAVALLTGCQAQQQQQNQPFAEVTQYLGPATATNTPIPVNNNVSGVSDAGDVTAPSDGTSDDGGSIFSNNPYLTSDDSLAADALGEEGQIADDTVNTNTVAYINQSSANAEATVYPYAGSTPIPLLPIDAPTPTPRPTLSFTYIPYTLTTLGLTFEAPAGWVPDETVGDQYTLTEPEAQMKDGQQGIITIYAVPVTSNYTVNNLKTEINQRLDTISATNFTSWKPSLTATRYLMGGEGVYANYSGTLASGVEVGGRIHATCINKVLYCLQITYPLGYKDDYLNIFAQVRTTLKRVQ